MSALAATALLAAACWLMRIAFLVLVPSERLPKGVRDALGHLAPAVLAALVTVEVVAAGHGLGPTRAAVLVVSVLFMALTARVTRSLGLTLVIGLVAAVLLDVVLV